MLSAGASKQDSFPLDSEPENLPVFVLSGHKRKKQFHIDDHYVKYLTQLGLGKKKSNFR
jgi:hypothetical protein